MKKIISVTLLLFSVAIIAAHADEQSAKVSTDLSGMRSGKSFSGHIYHISWSRITYDGRKVQKWVGGDSFDPPRYVFESIKLSIDGIEVSVPKNQYYDIYDPQGYGPFIMDDGHVLYLVIKAGDAAGSAQVWLRIEENRIVARKIKSYGPDGDYRFRN